MNPINILRQVFGDTHDPKLRAEEVANWILHANSALTQEQAMNLATTYLRILWMERLLARDVNIQRAFSTMLKDNYAPYIRLAAQRGVSALAIRSQENPPQLIAQLVREENEMVESNKRNAPTRRWSQSRLPILAAQLPAAPSLAE